MLRRSYRLYPAVQEPPRGIPPPSFGWHRPLAEPVRTRPALRTGLHQVLAAQPFPIISIGWWRPLNEPVRFRTLPAHQQQWFQFQPFPIISISWWRPLSEPVRLPRALHVTNQHVFEFQPFPIISIGWFQPLAQPVWPRRRGIAATLQHVHEFQPFPIISISWWQSLAEPVRLPRALGAAWQQVPSSFVYLVWKSGSRLPLFIGAHGGSYWKGRAN